MPNKKTLFENLIAQDKLRHAYLFFGDTAAAYAFAQELSVFLERGEWPDGGAEPGAEKEVALFFPPLLDVLLITPTDNVIGIDAVREARDFAYQKPFHKANKEIGIPPGNPISDGIILGRRTIVVNHAELLTAEAAASALKLTEDAPSATLLIFIAPQENVLPPALASRLMPVYFPILKMSAFPREARHPSPDDNLSVKLEALMLRKYEESRKRNAPLIRKLLRKQMELSRYNLNQKLQEKAIQYIIEAWK